ncbi:hypothetical protein J18TS1_17500 [Oceanobacillus oncorhynchi subsp. incaldanensis]|nr:hypothetical protein J18TS1_17500 [Oceanobacillus oncorhynchi subsp. incaldanensis]
MISFVAPVGPVSEIHYNIILGILCYNGLSNNVCLAYIKTSLPSKLEKGWFRYDSAQYSWL